MAKLEARRSDSRWSCHDSQYSTDYVIRRVWIDEGLDQQQVPRGEQLGSRQFVSFSSTSLVTHEELVDNFKLVEPETEMNDDEWSMEKPAESCAFGSTQWLHMPRHVVPVMEVVRSTAPFRRKSLECAGRAFLEERADWFGRARGHETEKKCARMCVFFFTWAASRKLIDILYVYNNPRLGMWVTDPCKAGSF